MVPLPRDRICYENRRVLDPRRQVVALGDEDGGVDALNPIPIAICCCVPVALQDRQHKGIGQGVFSGSRSVQIDFLNQLHASHITAIFDFFRGVFWVMRAKIEDAAAALVGHELKSGPSGIIPAPTWIGILDLLIRKM